MLKKILATASSDSLNWEMLPFLVSKIYNHTVTPRTGYKPNEMIMGKGKNTKAFFELEEKVPLHHSLKSIQSTVETLTKEINMLAESAKNQLNKRNELKKDKLNKTKIVKKFNKGDIVYALDRYTLPGNTHTPSQIKVLPLPLHSTAGQVYYNVNTENS